MHASLRAYRVVTGLLGPLTPLLLEARAKRGKEDPARMSEKRGKGRPRPPGPLAWLHGASVGESLSLLPLVERLVQSGLAVMVTTGTVSSANLIERRLPPGSFHHYVPLDVPSFVRRFLDHWRPDLALFAESELWPNLIIETERRGIPLVSVNARMSERSFRRWQRFSGTISDLLGRFTMCLAQSDADADRLLRLGAERVGIDRQSQIRHGAASRRSHARLDHERAHRRAARLGGRVYASGRGRTHHGGASHAGAAFSGIAHHHRATSRPARPGDRRDCGGGRLALGAAFTRARA